MMRIFVDDSFEDCNEENRFFLQYDDPELYYGDSEEDGTEVEDFYTEEDYDDKPF